MVEENRKHLKKFFGVFHISSISNMNCPEISQSTYKPTRGIEMEIRCMIALMSFD